jgi:hypothetical protein
MTVENIITRVQKLLRLSQANSNAEEAASAAAKAQELIDQHNLTTAMLALDGAEPEVDEPIYDFFKAGSPLDTQKTQQRWRGVLALHIAKMNSCRVYWSGASLALVGRPSDADTVRYLYGYLAYEVERLAATQAGMGRTWRNNFRLGVVDTIAEKLKAQHTRFVETARLETGTALVRVDRALAKIEQRGSSVDAWLKANLKLRGGEKRGARGDQSARAAGRQAGKSISIGAARGALGGQKGLSS